MTPGVIALALTAALLHATWNAFLRSGADRLWSVTVMSLSGIAVGLPLVLLFPLPAPEAWVWIGLSSGLQVFYSLFLVAAYRQGELGQVYPVVRGTVPLLVTLGGLVLTGEAIAGTQLLGVILVATGIMSLALGRGRASTPSLLYALATSLIIATYSSVDAIGVRRAGHGGAYAAWVLVLFGIALTLTFVALRGRLTLPLRAPETRKALLGGVFALLAYGLIVTAYQYGPAGPITALRETSVIFAVLIGRLFLGERLTARRLIACLVVVLGAVCLTR